MTNERKIEILEKCKFLLKREYETHKKLNFGICLAFFMACTLYERMESDGKGTAIFYHLGDTFTKHRPKNASDDYNLWFGEYKDGLDTRLLVIDVMIHELKQLL